MVGTSGLAIFLVAASGVSGLLAAGEPRPDYLQLVRAYADAMIEHGRDVYGPAPSPLLAEALDRTTLRMLEGERLRRVAQLSYADWGVRPHDRMLSGANPHHCENLYQILYALSDVTGDARYAAEADRSLAFFFKHCQSESTGLFYWGEHAGWDFHKEGPIDKPAGDTHEFYRPWVLWRRSWRLAPDACRRFARGLWDHQIGDHRTGDFSRHAAISRHGPGTEAPYARHGGFYIETWAAAYQKTRDPAYVHAIETVLDGLERARLHEGGMVVSGTRRRGGRRTYDVSLAVSLELAAAGLPEGLAGKLRRAAAANDAAFAAARSDVQQAAAAALWDNAYGAAPPAGAACVAMLRWRQTRGDPYRQFILWTADQYRSRGVQTERPVWPGTVGAVIWLMLDAQELTGDARYAAAADRFARRAVELFLGDGRSLPKASHAHDHYEAVTNGDTLMMALLRLARGRRPAESPRLVYCDR